MRNDFGLSSACTQFNVRPTFRQPGQTSVDEVKLRDLRADLLAAEAEARAKKRKAAGLPVEDQPLAPAAIEDGEANKRRKVLQEALEMDRDADSDEDEDVDGPKGDTKCVGCRISVEALIG